MFYIPREPSYVDFDSDAVKDMRYLDLCLRFGREARNRRTYLNG